MRCYLEKDIYSVIGRREITEIEAPEMIVILSPISAVLGLMVAVAMIGFNFAESYSARFALASWLFGFDQLGAVINIRCFIDTT